MVGGSSRTFSVGRDMARPTPDQGLAIPRRRQTYPYRVFLLALIPLVLGVVVGWGGLLGWREKLPRERGAGVRTVATLRSDEAFRIGNKVAGLPTIMAGVAGLLSGIAGLVMPGAAGSVIATVVGVVAMAALVIAGGLLGHRAALAVRAPAPAGCSGCACGGCSALQRA
jgi:hypothetical protein